MAETFFTADTHFGHNRIIEHSKRPFVDANEMNRELIARWNARVGPEDTVYHLGDFAMGKERVVHEALTALNGRKVLIAGNHDHTRTREHPAWQEVTHLKQIALDGQKIVLFHYPMLEWPGAWSGALHFYGHVHGAIPALDRRCDVGVDAWNYAPATLPEIRARLAEAPPYNPAENYAA